MEILFTIKSTILTYANIRGGVTKRIPIGLRIIDEGSFISQDSSYTILRDIKGSNYQSLRRHPLVL